MADAGKILITGGAGFIGSHLARRLLDQGHSLILLDNLSTGSRANVAPLLGPRCQLLEQSVSSALAGSAQLLDGVSQIYHLAATVGVMLVVHDPLAMVRTNIGETTAILDAAAGRRIPILLASSSEVYGKSPDLPLREDHDLLYGPTTAPRWSYALSKALDEHLALAHHRRDGLPVVIVRLFNTIGPRQIGQYGMVVPRFVQRAAAGLDLEVYGDGSQTRAFCDVRDVVRAMVDLLGDPRQHGQVFNVGSDREISIAQLARLVLELAGSSAGVKLVPYAQAYQANFEDMPRRVPDLTRIRQAIGFAPQYALEDTLKELLAQA